MKKLQHSTFSYLVLLFYCLFMLNSNNCNAEISPTNASKDYGDQWSKIQFQLEALYIKQRLLDYRLSSDEANTLIQKLTQEDIHKMVLTMGQIVPAGNTIIVAGIVLVLTILIAWLFFAHH